MFQIAAELMKTFPKIPHIKFDSSPKEMANERTRLGLEILAASGWLVYTDHPFKKSMYV